MVERNYSFLKGVHLARDAVQLSLAGLSTVVYLSVEHSYGFLFFLSLDIIGLVLLWIPRNTWNQLGYVWAGLMSIVLIFVTFNFLGNVYFFSAAFVILFLSSVELLAVMKVGYDNFNQYCFEDS